MVDRVHASHSLRILIAGLRPWAVHDEGGLSPQLFDARDDCKLRPRRRHDPDYVKKVVDKQVPSHAETLTTLIFSALPYVGSGIIPSTAVIFLERLRRGVTSGQHEAKKEEKGP